MSTLPQSLDRIRRESFVAAVEFHNEIGSTNDRALAMAEDVSVAVPTLVLAERQMGGRGRGNNRWWSGDGALTFSLLLSARELSVPVERRPQVSLTVGLGVCEALAELLPGHDFGLKWPNDVFVGTRKVCGILVEVPPKKSDLLVVGIGVNVNNSLAEAPPELRGIATSLADEAGAPLDATEVLLRVLARLADALELFVADPDELNAAWSRRCILTGRTVHMQAGPKAISGLCRGIAGDGTLLIDTPGGLERIMSGVIVRFE